MNKKDSFLQRAGNFLAGKGFYIVLFLCVAVIGASAWAMLSLNDTEIEDEQSELAKVSEQPGLTGPIDAQAAEDDDWSVMAEAEITEEPKVNETETKEETIAESPALETAEAGEATDETEAGEPETESAGITSYVWPVSGEVIVNHTTNELMYDMTMGDWRTHSGIDISADLGSKVIAMSSGIVDSIVEDSRYGTTITIDHGDDLKSVYSNLAATPTVSEGQSVSTGDIIGAVGETAIVESGIVNHLHLEVTATGMQMDPLDYLP